MAKKRYTVEQIIQHLREAVSEILGVSHCR